MAPGVDSGSRGWPGWENPAVGSTGAAFQVVLVLHVLSAVVGFGSIAATGCYARLGRAGDRQPPEAVRRYFGPGRNLPSRFILAVPVLGLALAGLGAGGDLAEPWLWASSGLWAGATALAAGVLWPAEARIQSLLAPTSLSPTSPTRPGGAELARAATRASRAAALVDLAAAAAFVLMVARPGS